MKRSLWVLLAIVLLQACYRAPAPPPPVAPREVVHTVNYPGETLSLISLWYTGSVANWPLIARRNPSVNPNKLKKGSEITIPRDMAIKSTPFDARYVRAASSHPAASKSTPQRNAEAPSTSETSRASEEKDVRPAAAPVIVVSPTQGQVVAENQYRRKRAAVLDELLQQ